MLECFLFQIFNGPSNTLLYSDDPALMTPNQTTTTMQAHINTAANDGMDLLFEHPDLTYTIDGTIWIPSDMKIEDKYQFSSKITNLLVVLCV